MVTQSGSARVSLLSTFFFALRMRAHTLAFIERPGEIEFKFICKEEEETRLAKQAIFNVPSANQINRERFDQRMGRSVRFHPQNDQLWDQTNADLYHDFEED